MKKCYDRQTKNLSKVDSSNREAQKLQRRLKEIGKCNLFVVLRIVGIVPTKP